MKYKYSLISIFIIFVFGYFHPNQVYAGICTLNPGTAVGGDGGLGGGPGLTGSSGQTGYSTGNVACPGGGGGGGGGGGSASGGSGGSAAGGSLLIKNTGGSMTLSGTVDTRGSGSSTTNGGTVKLFFTGSSPSTSGISSGRTYTSNLSGTNSTPSYPSLVNPGSGATNVSTSPLLQLVSSDPDNDYLRYKILLYNSDCTTGLQTFDQTSTQVGWSGQDQQTATAYTGNSVLAVSSVATYGAASLSANTQYCWKGAAIDPGGTNTFSSFSPTQLFTTGSATGQVQINGNTQIRGGTLLR